MCLEVRAVDNDPLGRAGRLRHRSEDTGEHAVAGPAEGLALGGVARVGQLQLAQPVLSLAWVALLLDEALTPPALAAAFGVMACVTAIQLIR